MNLFTSACYPPYSVESICTPSSDTRPSPTLLHYVTDVASLSLTWGTSKREHQMRQAHALLAITKIELTILFRVCKVIKEGN